VVQKGKGGGMREQADDRGSSDRKTTAAGAPQPAQPDWDRVEAFDRNRHHLWEAFNKALNTLILGHAAGLVTCLTLLKDYKDQGLGVFIRLFGAGLIRAGLGNLHRAISGISA
jgi:hypothetical protein